MAANPLTFNAFNIKITSSTAAYFLYCQLPVYVNKCTVCDVVHAIASIFHTNLDDSPLSTYYA